MNTKYSIQTITLYELYDNNNLFIISTIYNLIIAIFNYYSIIKLNFLQTQFVEFKTIFESQKCTTEICQSITFVTIFFLFYFLRHFFEKNNEKDNDKRLIFIMLISFLSKIGVFLYNYNCIIYIFFENNIEKPKKYFGLFYIIIELSYLVTFLSISATIVMLILFCFIGTIIFCSINVAYILNKIIEWSKTYRIVFKQEIKNDGSEDV